MSDTREVWLRGPIPEIPALLQPVAHALLQATKEITKATADFKADTLWIKPYNQASVGFHLQHHKSIPYKILYGRLSNKCSMHCSNYAKPMSKHYLNLAVSAGNKFLRMYWDFSFMPLSIHKGMSANC
jgi:hypothetical protein